MVPRHEQTEEVGGRLAKHPIRKYYPKANLGNFPQTFEDIIDLLRKIHGPSGVLLEYCVRDILVTFAYEDDTEKTPQQG